eukprot:scaffold27443_cov60-Phaeocystis_antarctica.AAC.2
MLELQSSGPSTRQTTAVSYAQDLDFVVAASIQYRPQRADVVAACTDSGRALTDLAGSGRGSRRA